MATNPFDDPQDMSPADLATAAAFGQRFATFLAAGKTPNTPYIDFTKNQRVTAHAGAGGAGGAAGNVSRPGRKDDQLLDHSRSILTASAGRAEQLRT